ncbi:FGGY family carbohydrate kinase [Agaribacterium sp. ZY112]|uniref:FGGY family carbohydrate kinase n=1 Tax=Agaribacterium sp. ZY112 TaxID=3233574 RepID=UPI00352599F0
MAQVVLVVDVGTHAVRAALMSRTGCQQQVSRELFFSSYIDSHVEQDANMLWQALQACLVDISKYAADCENMVLVCQRSSVLCWSKPDGCDDSYAALSPVLSWMDRRTQASLLALDAEQKAYIHSATGLQISPYYGASKIAYLQAQTSYGNASCQYGPLAAWLTSRLCRLCQAVCDESNAARTLLWKPKIRNWDERLSAIFKLDKSILPKPVPVSYKYGSVDLKGRPLTLSAVTGDQNAAYYALICAARNSQLAAPLLLNIGTGAFIIGGSSQHLASSSLLKTMYFSDASCCRFADEACINGAGAAITSFLSNEKLVNGEDEFFELAQSFMLSEPLDCVCLNKVGGLGSPWWQAKRQRNSGLELEFVDLASKDEYAGGAEGLPHRARALLESVAFLILENLQFFPGHSDVYISGGLARCQYLVEVIATLSKQKIYCLHVYELGLMGGAALAGLDYTFDDYPSSCIAANTGARPALKDRQARWRDWMPDYG